MKKITIYERETYVIINEYDYNTGKSTSKVAKRDTNGDYNPNKAQSLCDYFKLDAEVISTNNGEITFDITNTQNVQGLLRRLAKIDKCQYINVTDNGQITLKLYIN